MIISDILLEVNWLCVIVVTIFSFLLGAIWHSPVLFGKSWAEEIKRDKNQKVNAPLIFGVSAIANFIATLALAVIIGANSTALNGFVYGLVISLVWVSTSIGVTYLFASRSLKLFLIDAGYYIVFFSIAGLIIGAWQ
jgi:hypothetical protein